MNHLNNQFPKIITPFMCNMAENSCLKYEKELEKEFLEKGLISEKVFENMYSEIKSRRKKTT